MSPFDRFIKAFGYSVAGLKTGFAKDIAFRQESCAALILIPLGLYLGADTSEKILLAGSVLLLMIVELINSAIERVVDRVSLDRHELSKEAKDMGSAAVLLALFLAVMAWILILFF